MYYKIKTLAAASVLAMAASLTGSAYASIIGSECTLYYDQVPDAPPIPTTVNPCASFEAQCTSANGVSVVITDGDVFSGETHVQCVSSGCGPNQHWVPNVNGGPVLGGNCVDNPTYPGGGHGPTCDPFTVFTSDGVAHTCGCGQTDSACTAGPGRSIPTPIPGGFIPFP